MGTSPVVATKLEGLAVSSFVWTLLANDTGPGGVATLLEGRIYSNRVPQAAQLPALTVSLVDSVPLVTRGGRHVADRSHVDVHLIAQGVDFGALNPAAKRADVVIQNAGGTDGGVLTVELVRELTTAYVEDLGGLAYSHLVLSYETPSYEQ